MVGVEQGRVVAVRGDEASPVNKGLLCVKGYHLPGLLYGADRLLYPQRRQPDGSFARISWDDALDLIATKFGETLKQHGPEAVAMYGSGQWTVFDGYAGHLQERATAHPGDHRSCLVWPYLRCISRLMASACSSAPLSSH